MQFAYQTRQPNSESGWAIGRIALDHKVEGSNPSSPATSLLTWLQCQVAAY